MLEPSQQFIIKGRLKDGSRFRPSDWCERLATTLACFDRNKRLQYNDYVKPSIVDDFKSLIVHGELKVQSPKSFEFLLAFAIENQLDIDMEAIPEKGKLTRKTETPI
ncbi:MAG: DUF3579 domain-containing protein [Pseudomonadota bacterium]